jgi:hypothetical protein
MAEKQMKVLCREHFFDLLDSGHEEFRIKTVTLGKNRREIQEDAPFDKDDPMSYVLVNLIFDEITIFAKGDFSAHDIAEAQRVYGGIESSSFQAQIDRLKNDVKELKQQLLVLSKLLQPA